MINVKQKGLNNENLLIYNNLMAGDESRAGNPLFADFISVGRRLEKLGFTYHRGSVIVLEPLEEQ